MEAIAFLAVISGADGWIAIETYANSKPEKIRKIKSLPRHATLQKAALAGIYIYIAPDLSLTEF
ncbi:MULTISPECIES: hypothetical protein [unclassified Coleofasciculus]|uniref:hypothetical protein n=1 Tax=unclassified Coleofasciculus TaxID=2692782 RepID=UPI001882BCA9|nr:MULTISPECIES: hypothetical protein [unclassified Coleofasciculus]MBE9125698.1 hypothetical protein [Coleofasciculus sp. LEGE 07081]MBE9148309.1 hypothetical protein [Coleofasciculus sp. LEGE 07092]